MNNTKVLGWMLVRNKCSVYILMYMCIIAETLLNNVTTVAVDHY